MTSVAAAVQEKLYVDRSDLSLRRWKIPPDVTTEETERALTASCLRERSSAVERWFHRDELLPHTLLFLSFQLQWKKEEGAGL